MAAAAMASSAATEGAVGAVHSIREYEKFIKFREDILAGTHPRIKPPAHASKQAGISRPGQSTAGSSSNGQNNGLGNNKANSLNSFQANSQHQVAKSVGQDRPVPAAKPVHVEKSDNMARAEIRLKRQRIERQLRDEVEEHRRRLKMPSNGDMPDFDLSEVLIKALQRVQATLPPAAAADGRPANSYPSSDSFDDNTFYSSQHDTPDSQNSARRRQTDSEDDDMANDSNYEPQMPSGPVPSTPQQSTGAQYIPLMTGALPRPASGAAAQQRRLLEMPGSHESGEASRSHSDSYTTDCIADQVQHQEARKCRGRQPALEPREPRLVRSHDLSPVAPQPAHVSTLATSRDVQMPRESFSVGVTPGTPAQVVALRGKAGASNTSPESSPQTGNTGADRKKKKRKRRKAGEDPVVDEVSSFFIKTEPRSPSPISAAPAYTRPLKRQRQDGGGSEQISTQDLTQDNRRYGHAQPSRTEGYHLSGQYEEERYTVAYEGARRQALPVAEAPRFDQELIENGRAAPCRPVRQPRSPDVYVQYAEQASPRPQSQVAQPYYRELPHESSRMSSLPEIIQDQSRSPVMAPSRHARIIVDHYGREYIEPTRPTVIRHSVAPISRHGEPEFIYERTVPRATSRRPDAYNDGVGVRRASPSFQSRRLITQPELQPADYRSYRQQEYSARPGAPVEEYVAVRNPIERRFEEPMPQREYISRPMSVRPADPVRYEVSRDYDRVQSVRPDMQFREYVSSGEQSDGRRPVVQQTMSREIGSHRSGEPHVVRQEYIRPLEDRFYESRPVRRGEEIAFIERPRGATQEIVYADDVRREIYR